MGGHRATGEPPALSCRAPWRFAPGCLRSPVPSLRRPACGPRHRRGMHLGHQGRRLRPFRATRSPLAASRPGMNDRRWWVLGLAACPALASRLWASADIHEGRMNLALAGSDGSLAWARWGCRGTVRSPRTVHSTRSAPGRRGARLHTCLTVARILAHIPNTQQRGPPMSIPGSVRQLIESGPLAHVVTLGSRWRSAGLAGVGRPRGDEVVIGTLFDQAQAAQPPSRPPRRDLDGQRGAQRARGSTSTSCCTVERA